MLFIIMVVNVPENVDPYYSISLTTESKYNQKEDEVLKMAELLTIHVL